jgi:hypothetical protein
MKHSLDKILALSGSILGSTLAVIIPTLCHLKYVANSKREKVSDMVIVSMGSLALLITTFQVISKW